MQYNQFGKTGCSVSRLGFGCMRFPTVEKDGKNVIDEPEAVKMLRMGIDSGINYVDTAYFYHDGESELVVGRALQNGYREKVYLATKLPMGNVKTTEDFDRLLNDQLAKLQTDHIDFYLFHALNREHWETVKRLGLMEKMEQAKADGRIRHCGFSFHDDLEVFEQILTEYKNCEFCQIQLSYLDEDYQAGIEGLKKAYSMGLGVIIMEPLRGGRLANPEQPIKECFPEQTDYVKAALDYLWNQKEVSLLLSGMSTYEQVQGNLLYANDAVVGKLSQEQAKCYSLARAEANRMSLIPCTACQYCQPCAKGVEIPKIFAAFNTVANANRREVKRIMPDIEYKISACVQCGACEKKCPQQIEIMKELKRIKDSF